MAAQNKTLLRRWLSLFSLFFGQTRETTITPKILQPIDVIPTDDIIIIFHNVPSLLFVVYLFGNFDFSPSLSLVWLKRDPPCQGLSLKRESEIISSPTFFARPSTSPPRAVSNENVSYHITLPYHPGCGISFSDIFPVRKTKNIPRFSASQIEQYAFEKVENDWRKKA